MTNEVGQNHDVKASSSELFLKSSDKVNIYLLIARSICKN